MTSAGDELVGSDRFIENPDVDPLGAVRDVDTLEQRCPMVPSPQWWVGRVWISTWGIFLRRHLAPLEKNVTKSQQSLPSHRRGDRVIC